MEASSLRDVQEQFDVLRQNLLDLTMRNQLLNFRPRVRSIEVVEEIVPEIYNILVLEEKKMQFSPKKEPLENDKAESKLTDEISDSIEDEAAILWKLPEPDVKLDERYIDRFLETDLTSKELQKRLFYIYQQAKSVFEEQGYNILYLALGFLEWRESPDSDIRKAPLILVPVELERKKVRGSFKISWTGEDISSNISLQSKLLDQNIKLPDFEMPEGKDGVHNYLKSVQTAIQDMDDWNVSFEIYLSFFSFTKFVMFKDLDPESWPDGTNFVENPIINSIFNPSDIKDSDIFSEDDVDKKLPSSVIYHVVDADSSQIAAMEDVKSGTNLVVEGPPGTGKSQTIVNLIAELIANGKTVLFVSEKMAALEVVKDRLDRIDLGEFCLELHSRKSNKKEVLKELERTLNDQKDINITLKEDFEELDKLRLELNRYNAILHEPFGEIKFSPYYLYGMKEEALNHFKNVERTMPRAKIENPDKYNFEEWQDAISALENLGELLKFLKPLSEHPWRHSAPELIFPSDEDEIKRLLDQSMEYLMELKNHIDNLSDITAVTLPTNKSELDDAISSAMVIKASKTTEREIIANSEWDHENEMAYQLIKELEEYNAVGQNFLKNFHEGVLDENIHLMLDEFEESSSKFLKFLRGSYKKAKKSISDLYKFEAPENDNLIIQDMEVLIKCQSLRNSISAAEGVGKSLFGSFWKAEYSDPEELKELSKWLVTFRRLLSSGKINKKCLDILGKGISAGEIKNSIESINEIYDGLLGNINILNDILKMDCKSVFKDGFNNVSFGGIYSQMEIFRNNLHKLQQWSQFIDLRSKISNKLAVPIIKLINEDKLEPGDIIPCFKGNFSDDMLKTIFMENPALSRFVGELHENKIKKFIDLDRKLISLNSKRIAKNLYNDRPRILGGISPNSELGILLGEFNRKRRHMPIRKLLSRIGGLIQKIKPCFMMSPLSIAQFIDPMADIKFDVVIFDEASQVKPEDALGAFLRGNQAVVMGDTRQLPPTSFFDVILDTSEEDYELTPMADMESILHLCKGSFSTKMLRWHYRSRHESLIAVSNQEFYDNKLLIYPSPCHESDYLGLKFVYLPDTIYDRGRSSVNRKEAKEVVKYALEHYERFGNKKSLGIGTFNVRQQQAILEEVELQLKLNPEMEEHFSSNYDESFFVKNLETIQGDERDVIFVSVGFGFDSNGKLSQNFGPLNQDGGERRLNVLITRAREKCVVFSNFKSNNLRIDHNSPFGLRALKVFLEYAENKQLISIQTPGEDTDSPFEDSVYEFLREHGYGVHKQVGCAGFRVDLAVIDPNNQGRYLLGIECDGAMYHSSPVARDRDRLRQQILENLGWRIYRIWSTDWYRNRIESQEKLLNAIKDPKNIIPNITRSSLSLEIEEKIKSDDSSKNIQINEIKQPDLELSIENEIMEYEVCSNLGVRRCEFTDNNLNLISDAVIQIVKVEGPVHFDEVVRRLRLLWGIRRFTKRMKEVVKNAIELSNANGNLVIRGKFLQSRDNLEIKVRRRTGDPPAKINLISDDEIAEAMKLILKFQYATAPDELITKVSRLFGINITRGTTAERIENVIEKLIKGGELQKMPNGFINFSNKI